MSRPGGRRTGRSARSLPRVNRLADVYNALSVLHQVPIGGEGLSSTANELLAHLHGAEHELLVATRLIGSPTGAAH